jgi:hypothetical protein
LVHRRIISCEETRGRGTASQLQFILKKVSRHVHLFLIKARRKKGDQKCSPLRCVAMRDVVYEILLKGMRRRGGCLMTLALTRRGAFAALASFVLPSPLAAQGAMAQAGVRFRNIQVDVSPLRASAGAPTADWVQRELPGALAQSLADHMAPGDRAAATLVARVDYLYLGPNSGGPGFLHSTQDTINGVLIVKGPRGAVVAKTPLRAISSYYPSAVDQPLFEESNHWRVAALAQAFAGWAPRELRL